MAALRLKDVAHEAVTASLVLRVAQMETPENGHLARICRHALYERPHEHEEKNVEHGQEGYDLPVVCRQHNKIMSAYTLSVK